MLSQTIHTALVNFNYYLSASLTRLYLKLNVVCRKKLIQRRVSNLHFYICRTSKYYVQDQRNFDSIQKKVSNKNCRQLNGFCHRKIEPRRKYANRDTQSGIIFDRKNIFIYCKGIFHTFLRGTTHKKSYGRISLTWMMEALQFLGQNL